MLTKEDLETLYNAIYCTYLMDLMQTYLRQAEAETSPLRTLFIATNQHLMDVIHADLVQVKKKLKAAGIRYVKLPGTEYNTLQFQHFCRGYEDRLSLTREHAKAEMEIRLTAYVNKAMNILSSLTR